MGARQGLAQTHIAAYDHAQRSAPPIDLVWLTWSWMTVHDIRESSRVNGWGALHLGNERVRVTTILFKLRTATLLGSAQLESERPDSIASRRWSAPQLLTAIQFSDAAATVHHHIDTTTRYGRAEWSVRSVSDSRTWAWPTS